MLVIPLNMVEHDNKKDEPAEEEQLRYDMPSAPITQVVGFPKLVREVSELKQRIGGLEKAIVDLNSCISRGVKDVCGSAQNVAHQLEISVAAQARLAKAPREKKQKLK